MVFKFYQIYRSIKEVLGEEKAMELFPEYHTLPDKMPTEDQINLARILMDRLDNSLDRDTVIKIRRQHPCNIPKVDKEKMKEIKETFENINDRIKAYSKYLGGSFSHCGNNVYYFSWGNTKCPCGMFRKADSYEKISPTWCQCCNANNILQMTFLCDKEVESELLQGVCSGGTDCSFRVTVLNQKD